MNAEPLSKRARNNRPQALTDIRNAATIETPTNVADQPGASPPFTRRPSHW
jgi:hypothetical protein